MWKCWLANFVKSCPRKPPSHQFASKGSACTQQILCEDCGTLFLAQWDKSLSGVIFLILYCPIIYLDFPNLYIKGGGMLGFLNVIVIVLVWLTFFTLLYSQTIVI